LSASEAKLANVYEDEYKSIQRLGWEVQQYWNEIARTIDISNLKETSRKINEFSKWTEDKFEKIGFLVLVDPTPIYADRPPTISLVDRTSGNNEFDHEKKRSEIRRNNGNESR
jgi:hypothetical protein